MNLRPHLLRDAEYRRRAYEVILEAGTSYEDVQKPDFWAHVARKLKIRDRIEVHAHDGSWFADLMVRSTSQVTVVVAPLQYIEFKDSAAGKADGDGLVEIKFRGAAKWSAIRKADKAILVEGLDSREAVEVWLKGPQKIAA